MSELAYDLDLRQDARSAMRASPARAAVRELLTSAGFRPIELGGGGEAWYRWSDDGTHALISHNGALYGDPAVKDWIVGQYGERGGFVEVGGLSLARALEGADTLPSPVRPDGSLVEALYPSLQQALDDLG